ncbi:Hsp70 protein-domain-containing protein [Lipomyces oligophaga]|uniref:Hsp70 protein-domain-containing protein n=1 Tax=Lipomyces oligophaga TaxID=45792 RepID=UPI0034CF68D0
MIRLRHALTALAVLLILLPGTTLAAILAVDFGQSSTKAVLVSPGVPFEIVLSRDSKRKDVSGLAFKGDERLYGGAAGMIAPRFPATSFLNFKPVLGKSIDSPEAALYLDRHPGSTFVPSANRSTVSFKTPDSSFSLEEVLAMSFAHLKVLAEEMLPKDSATRSVRDVAITVPPFFDSVQRKAIIDAADIAGLKVVALVTDGLAAAINYASSRSFGKDKQYNIIWDVGAGSSSATVVSFTEGADGTSILSKPALNVTVEGVGYDSTLGGDLIDDRLYEILLARFTEKYGDAILSNARSLIRLRKEAERVKSILSANTEVRVSMESLFEDNDFRTEVTRSELESAIEDLYPQIKAPFETALKQAGIDILEVSSVIVMGGSTRIPVFQRVVIRDVLNGDATKLSKTVNADETAVMGAALRGVGVSKQFRAKEINVVEPIMNDYLFKSVITSTSGAKTARSEILFPSSSNLIGNKTLFPLNLPDDAASASLEFLENGRTLFEYSLTGIDETRSKILSANNCSSLVSNLEAELSISRTFDVTGFGFVCNVTLPKDGDTEGEENEDFKQKIFDFFKGNKKDDSSDEDSATTDTQTTATETESESATTTATTSTTETSTKAKAKPSAKPKPKYVRQAIKGKRSYSGPRNLGKGTKTASQTRLRAFDRLDADRAARDTARNSLEAYAYRVREWIEYQSIRFMQHSTEEEREGVLNLAADALEWLYEEGESMVLSSIQEKLKQLREFENRVIQRETELLRASASAASAAAESAAAAESDISEGEPAEPEFTILPFDTEHEETFTILPLEDDGANITTMPAPTESSAEAPEPTEESLDPEIETEPVHDEL